MVRCADCGLLGLRNLEEGGIEEATVVFRRDGIDASGYRKPNPQQSRGFFIPSRYDHTPLCTAGQILFHPAENEGEKFGDIMLPQLTQERDCAAFVQWQRGKSPAEHEAIMERQLEVERDERRHGEMMGVLKMQVWIMGVGMIVMTLIAAIVASLMNAALR